MTIASNYIMYYLVNIQLSGTIEDTSFLLWTELVESCSWEHRTLNFNVDSPCPPIQEQVKKNWRDVRITMHQQNKKTSKKQSTSTSPKK
jgi:hypothetical protein